MSIASLNLEAGVEPFPVAGVSQRIPQLLGELVVFDPAVVAPEAQSHGAHDVFDSVEPLQLWERAIE